MTPNEWKLLAEKLERERLSNKFSQHTNDVLAALRNAAMGMWADRADAIRSGKE